MSALRLVLDVWEVIRMKYIWSCRRTFLGLTGIIAAVMVSWKTGTDTTMAILKIHRWFVNQLCVNIAIMRRAKMFVRFRQPTTAPKV